MKKSASPSIQDDHPRRARRKAPGRAAPAGRKSDPESAYPATFPTLNPNPIAEVDLEGRIRYLNPTAEQLFPDLRRRGPDHPWLGGWEAVVRLFREGAVKQDAREVCADRRWFLQTIYFMEETGCLRIYGVDITEHKKAERALRREREVMDAVVKVTDVLLAYLDRDFNFVAVNPAYAEASKMRPEDLIGRNHFALYPHEENEAIFRRVRDTGKPVFFKDKAFEYPDQPERGVTYWDWSLSPVKDGAGRVAGLVLTLHETTERRKAQVELQQRTAQLEEANRELESFSYSVSHDLRAPLRAIDGYTRMILRKQGDGFDEDTLRRFNVIRENVRTMDRLIDALLGFSRLGRAELSMSLLDVRALIETTWQEALVHHPGRDVTLTLGNVPAAYGDETLIRQVFSNLLSNALKFTRPREAARIEVGGFREANEAVFCVKDNGVGFDMTYYRKLFGVFQRLHSAEDFEGTGVGLATVQRIVYRHGGRVWAESVIDKGASFYFTLKGPA
ncbi:MAG TPA: PAS domain-containing protein [Syntrophales bacterium]|nr:PAS domain-containing protein [Syntrophales bacterium]